MDGTFQTWTEEKLASAALLIKDEKLLNRFLGKTHIDKSKFYVLAPAGHNEMKKEIRAHGIQLVISQQDFLHDLNVLQWECPTFHTYYILDCDNPLEADDARKNYLMNKKLWEYTVNNAKDELAGGGWVNSYNREPFSKLEMDEFSDNVYQKLKPYLHKTVKVLEIGCSTGLTMFKLLPYVGAYHAADLSGAVLEKDKQIAEQQGYDNVAFYNLPADEIDKIDEADFDIIIMNSVIQCFHGYNYFRKVLRKCIDKLGTKGIIFLGDVMDLDMKEELEAALRSYKELYPDADTKLAAKGEVFYPRGFFEDCMAELSEIEKVEFSSKLGTVNNELTDYRYDIIMQINYGNKICTPTKQKKQFNLNV